MTRSSIKSLEADLWASADVLRANANLNASQYCMPVLCLLFLKYAYGRYKKVEAEISTLIHKTLFSDLPESYGIEEIQPYSEKLYEYIYERYPFVAA